MPRHGRRRRRTRKRRSCGSQPSFLLSPPAALRGACRWSAPRPALLRLFLFLFLLVLTEDGLLGAGEDAARLPFRAVVLQLMNHFWQVLGPLLEEVQPVGRLGEPQI